MFKMGMAVFDEIEPDRVVLTMSQGWGLRPKNELHCYK